MTEEQVAAAASQGKREKKKKSMSKLGLKKKNLRTLWNSACRTAVRRRI